jgi:hypothetical protein
MLTAVTLNPSPGMVQAQEKAPLIFATWVTDATEEKDALMLVESLREYGGVHAKAPIWIFAPDYFKGKSSQAILDAFSRMEASFFFLTFPQPVYDFYYAFKTCASAEAEQKAEGAAKVLVWMDPDTIFVREPSIFNLAEGITFGYRPVYYQNIGSPFADPLDEFWKLVYRDCRVAPEEFFSMKTACKQIPLRPYFNAGLIVIRPEKGVLRKWKEHFLKTYQSPDYLGFYKTRLYKIFVHQAILAGTVLANINPEEMIEFPVSVNFGLAQQGEYPPEFLPKTLNECYTLRTEYFFAQGWREKFNATDPLKSFVYTRR